MKNKFKIGILATALVTSSLVGLPSMAQDLEVVDNIGDKQLIHFKEGETIQDKDSIGLSVKLSKSTFSKSEAVIIAEENSTVDILASAPLSGSMKAPLLLTKQGGLDKRVLEEMGRLGVKKVFFTSGDNMIDEKVKNELELKGYEVVDFSAKDRYETANNIARYLIKNDSDVEKFILVNGENFADAAAISTFAYQKRVPILLTNNKIINSNTLKIVDSNRLLLIIGGENSVSKKHVDKLNDMYIKTGRIAGKDRYETSREVVRSFFINTKKLMVVNGKNIKGGILTAAYTGENNRPLLLVRDNPNNVDYLKDKNIIYLK